MAEYMGLARWPSDAIYYNEPWLVIHVPQCRRNLTAQTQSTHHAKCGLSISFCNFTQTTLLCRVNETVDISALTIRLNDRYCSYDCTRNRNHSVQIVHGQVGATGKELNLR